VLCERQRARTLLLKLQKEVKAETIGGRAVRKEFGFGSEHQTLPLLKEGAFNYEEIETTE
jgi:hypothetical protein